MRQHGWELPYHPLQVVAIAVFVSLAFAFYVFFIPFLGSKVLEYHVIAIFSPLVILVFALYIRCAAANPADPGIEIYNKSCGKSKASTKSSNSNKNEVIEEKPTIFKKALSLLFPCCAARSSSGRSRNQEDLLYCSLCEAEIFKYSKHCRACDKCVDGFDHHCRWINNCIGKKNYRTFVSLMVAGLLLLVIEWSAGVFVIVRCLLNRKDFQDDIVSKLGSSFSLVPFIVVVGLCTVLALLATLPLGQLFFFHLILIHKGISTYDYIVAMRERDQAQGDINSLQSSPVSSVATAVSNVSSLGALQRRPWCTPPRFLVEQQDTLVKDPLGGDIEHNGKEIVPLSTKKDDLAKNAKPKKQVKISPWKLARLNPEEVSKAAERARIKSSVLKPVTVINDTSVITETDSSNDSFGRSPGPEIVPLPASRKTKRKRDMSPAVKQKKAPSSKHSGSSVGKHSGSSVGKHSGCSVPDIGNEDSVAPLQMEARSAFWPASSSADNYNGNGYNGPRPWLQRSVSDGYEASGGESGEDSEHGRRLAHAWNRIRQSTTFMNRGALRPPPWVNATSQVRFANGEVGILKNTGMGWENPVPAVNSRRGNSTEESNSEASQYNSPDRDSDFFSAGDTSRPDLQKVHVQDG